MPHQRKKQQSWMGELRVYLNRMTQTSLGIKDPMEKADLANVMTSKVDSKSAV